MPSLTHGPQGSILNTKSSQPLEFKVLGADEGIFEALCNTTGIVDSVDDLMEPGVFKNSLQNRKPKILKDHIWENTIGKVLAAEELMPGDPRLPYDLQAVGAGALYIKGQINRDTQVGKDAWSDLTFFGDETEFSIGFTIPPGGSEYDSKAGIRKVSDVDLMEVSVVLWGASPGTRTLSLKRAQGEHSTPVSDSAWDRVRSVKNIQKRPIADNYRKAFAWANFEDSDDITNYSHLHHFVSDQGVVGGASLKACLEGIESLNDGSDSYSEEDRKGIFAHLAQHITDGGLEVPQLKNSESDESKGAISYKKTDTSDAPWDGPAQKANLKNDAGASIYKQAYAWVDSGADADKKTNYKFIHHFVSASGDVGAASTVACSSGIGVLNGGRSGTTIPNSDRKGVYNHLAGHLKAAGKDVPDLKSLEELEEIKDAAPLEMPEDLAQGDTVPKHKYVEPEGSEPDGEAPCIVCGEPKNDSVHTGYKALAHPYQAPADDPDGPCRECGMPKTNSVHGGYKEAAHTYKGPAGNPTGVCQECGLYENEGNHTSAKALEEKPYHIEQHEDKYCVVNSDTNEEVPGGCHSDRASAVAHLRALYANVPDAKDADGDAGAVGATDANPDPDNDGDDDRVTVPHLFFPLYGYPGKCAICRNPKTHKLHRRAEQLSEEAEYSVICNNIFTVKMLGAETQAHCEKEAGHTSSHGFADDVEIEVVPNETDTDKARELEAALIALNTSAAALKSAQADWKAAASSLESIEEKDLDPAVASLVESIDSQVDALMDSLGVEDPDETDEDENEDADAAPEDISALVLQALDAQVDVLMAVLGLDDVDADKGVIRDALAQKLVSAHEARSAKEEIEEKVDVSFAGSFEDTATRLSGAINGALPTPLVENAEQAAWIEATFSDTALVCVTDYTVDDYDGLTVLGQRYFSYPYSNETGSIQLGDPTEVQPTGVLVAAKSNDDHFIRTVKALEEKVGRPISAANLNRITEAVDALNAVIDATVTNEPEIEAVEETTTLSLSEIMTSQMLRMTSTV